MASAVVVPRSAEQLLDGPAGMSGPHLRAGGVDKVKVWRRNVFSTALGVAIVSVLINNVAASSGQPPLFDTSPSLSGKAEVVSISTDGERESASSAALHLSGGGSVRCASKAAKMNAVAQQLRPRPLATAKPALVNTFVPPPPRHVAKIGNVVKPHEPSPFLVERQPQLLGQPAMVGSYVSPQQGIAPLATFSDMDATSTAQAMSRSQQGLGTEAIVLMGLLALQFGVQPLLVRKFTPPGIVRSSVVLAQETIKFVVAAALYLGGTSQEQRQKDTAGWSMMSWLTVAAVPAALYTVQNLASLLAYQNLEALTFNVLNQTKILSAAVCCYLVMGKKQSRMQALSLLLLSGSAMIIERMVTLQSLRQIVFGCSGGSGLLASISGALGSLAFSGSSRRITHGVMPVLIASFISGLAGALTQKNLQGAPSKTKHGVERKPRNSYLFSMEMNVASAVILLMSLFFSADGKIIAESGFFHLWTPKTVIPIVTNSLGGIVVGLVTKHAGSVRKGFALIFGLLLSGLIQAGSAGISAEQIVGGVLAAVSLWLHTTHPHKPRTIIA